MFNDLLGLVTQHVPLLDFYRKYVPEYDGTPGRKYACPFPRHTDADPSFLVNQDGSFKCFGCEVGGGGPVKFLQLVKELATAREAAVELYGEYIRPVVSQYVLEQYRRRLKEKPEYIERLAKDRGWRPNVIGFLGLGITSSGDRVAIPYFNEHGLCTAVFYYNVFGAINPATQEPYEKLKPAKTGMETGRLWPKSSLEKSNEIVLCEGYADCILLLSMDVAAVTIGSCTNKITTKDVIALKEKEVYVVYDTDDPGQAGARDVANRLAARDVVVKVVDLPIEHSGHNDVTDYLHVENHTLKAFFSVIAATDYYKPDVPELISSRTLLYGETDSEDSLLLSSSPSPPPFVSLQGVRESTHYNKPYMTEAVVVGKATHTFFPPRKIRTKCQRPKEKCSGVCPFYHATGKTRDLELDPEDPNVIKLFEAGERDMTRLCKEIWGVAPGCLLSCTVVDSFAVSKVLVAPPISRSQSIEKQTEAIQVFGYVFGVNIQQNVAYLFEGYSTAHPNDRSMVAMFLRYKPVATTLDSFKMTNEVRDELSKFRYVEEGSLFERLLEYYDHCAHSITGIKERPLVHMAVDLCFHSPVSFVFNGDFIRKGSLDVLVFGDSGTGKNFITDGFQSFYAHGETISGENVSPMNLIGGIKMLSKFRGLQWGRFVMRHRDTVIMDEMSAIKPENFSLLSRIRCHGIADLDKDGLHQKAEAICGIIWLSNQRDRRVMADYQFGIEVLRTLVPQHEDIRRFDYVVALAHGEVSSEVINRNGQMKQKHRFTQDDCHNLILWIKSRSPEQIEFTNDCTHYILEQAIRFGKEYTDEYPIALPENMRFKLAKVATSIAGRIFSASTDGERIIVTKRCAEAGVAFLDRIYRSDALGYKAYSDVSRSYASFDVEELAQELAKYAEDTKMPFEKFCALFGMQKTISFDHIMAATALEPAQMKTLKNLLAHHRCILQRTPSVYEKSRGFIRFLKGVLK
jgi:5S rRNA maturation endonuclease (ribonuclease M5)